MRAFLNVGLGRLRLMLGPIAWISNIPLLGQTTLVASTTSSVAAVATAGALALGVPAGPLPSQPPPARIEVVEVAAPTGVTAPDLTVTGAQDEPLIVALSGLLVNDSDPNGDPLTITSVQDPIGGTATLMSTHVVFVPDPDLNGSAEFAYVACDPGNLCALATVVLTFTPSTLHHVRPTMTTASSPGTSSRSRHPVCSSTTSNPTDRR